MASGNGDDEQLDPDFFTRSCLDDGDRIRPKVVLEAGYFRPEVREVKPDAQGRVTFPVDHDEALLFTCKPGKFIPLDFKQQLQGYSWDRANKCSGTCSLRANMGGLASMCLNKALFSKDKFLAFRRQDTEHPPAWLPEAKVAEWRQRIRAPLTVQRTDWADWCESIQHISLKPLPQQYDTLKWGLEHYADQTGLVAIAMDGFGLPEQCFKGSMMMIPDAYLRLLDQYDADFFAVNQASDRRSRNTGSKYVDDKILHKIRPGENSLEHHGFAVLKRPERWQLKDKSLRTDTTLHLVSPEISSVLTQQPKDISEGGCGGLSNAVGLTRASTDKTGTVPSCGVILAGQFKGLANAINKRCTGKKHRNDVPRIISVYHHGDDDGIDRKLLDGVAIAACAMPKLRFNSEQIILDGDSHNLTERRHVTFSADMFRGPRMSAMEAERIFDAWNRHYAPSGIEVLKDGKNSTVSAMARTTAGAVQRIDEGRGDGDGTSCALR